MTSPAYDSSAGTFGFNITSANHGSGTTSWGTAAAARTVILVIAYGTTSGVGGVSSISETLGTLTFSKRGSIQNSTSGAHACTIEVWEASAPTGYNSPGGSTNQTWTVNFSGNVDSCRVTIMAFSGLFSTTAPFDNGVGLPASNFNTTSTTPPTVTFSTALADDLNLFISARTNGGSATSTPSGYTLIVSASNAAGINWGTVAVYYKSVSAIQTGATVADASATSDVSCTEYVDAFTADNNSGGGGGGGGGSATNRTFPTSGSRVFPTPSSRSFPVQ